MKNLQAELQLPNTFHLVKKTSFKRKQATRNFGFKSHF